MMAISVRGVGAMSDEFTVISGGAGVGKTGLQIGRAAKNRDLLFYLENLDILKIESF